MERLEKIIGQIKAPDQALAEKAQAHLDNLTKPRGALGRLEEIARRLCVMRGSVELSQPNCAVAVFAADHGAAAAGMSAFPREVTAQMVMNFLNGGAGINVLARQVGAAVLVVDVGVDHDFPQLEGLVSAKVARGTANLLQEPAMSREQAIEAIMKGVKVAQDLIGQGHDLLIPGEMGIGNTTASSALAAVFTGLPVAQVTGRGTGLDDAGLKRKVEAIQGGPGPAPARPGRPLGRFGLCGRPGDSGHLRVRPGGRRLPHAGHGGRAHLHGGLPLRGPALPPGPGIFPGRPPFGGVRPGDHAGPDGA